jgi:hypothetical protein
MNKIKANTTLPGKMTPLIKAPMKSTIFHSPFVFMVDKQYNV